MVARCNNAASASRQTRRAWRVGGGVNADGSSKVSSMLKVRVPATIVELFLTPFVSWSSNSAFCDIFPNQLAVAVILPLAFQSAPASGGIPRSEHHLPVG